MTKDQARIILLTHALQQAQSTVEFMHGCLTAPEHYKYEYPEMQLKSLDEWAKLAPRPPICVHSMSVEGCAGCKARIDMFRDEAEAKEVLKNEQPPEP